MPFLGVEALGFGDETLSCMRQHTHQHLMSFFVLFRIHVLGSHGEVSISAPLDLADVELELAVERIGLRSSIGGIGSNGSCHCLGFVERCRSPPMAHARRDGLGLLAISRDRAVDLGQKRGLSFCPLLEHVRGAAC